MGEGPGSVVNINIGVLGHVDSGKTSLVRALSTKLSTASLDKHPQSKERGITIDLGFSAFTTAAPEKLKECGVEQVQYTLVDCPGHASLIRTIIGGAQIIDRMVLVVDVTKGIQTQTAECLVIGEILTDDLTVVLNKVDLLPEKQRDEALQKVTKTIRQTLDTTRFKNAPILSIAAVIGGDGKGGVGENSGGSTEVVESLGLDELVDYLKTTTVLPDRTAGKGAPFYFAVDHCFAIKGQGTVLTGTVLNGSVEVGQVVELPQLKEERKVKSIQMFRQAVQRAEMGDRAAVCVTNLNAKSLERGVLTAPGSVPATSAAIALVRKVKYFPLQCPSRSKVHVTVGHITTMCTVTFFGSKQLHEVAATAQGKTLPSVSFDPSEEFLYDEELRGGGKAKGGPFLHWALLEFDQPIICQQDGMVIGSRLDLDQDTKSCRLAFYGKVSKLYPQALTSEELSKLRVYKLKERLGAVDRVADDKGTPGDAVHKVIVKNMFAKHADLDRFLGKKLFAPGGEEGIIDSTFGKTGKFNAVFPDGAKLSKGDALALRFKHLVFAPTQVNKTIIQDASVASAPTTPPKAP